MFKISAYRFPFFGILLVALLCFVTEGVKAQCYGYNRIFADAETANSNVTNSFGHLFDNTDVSNSANAIGSNLTNFSTITIPISIVNETRYQRLHFPQTFTNQEPIHVKLSSDISFSLSGITVQLQAYSGTTAVGSPVVVSTAPLTNVLSGQNISDVLITNPGVSYDGVQVTYTGVGLAIGKIYIYAAYINELVTTGVDCEPSADVLYGTTSGLLGGANSITNPNNAVDNDLTTYATINQNLGAAGSVFVTSLLPAPTVSGDLVSVTFQVPGIQLGADLFTNLSVIAYKGNDIVATIPANDATIGIRLLNAVDNIYQFTYPVGASFDRISVQAGGIATAIQQIYVYDIRRLVAKPVVKIDGVQATTKSFCVGNSVSFGLVNPQSCTDYKWYDAAVGGNLLQTATTYSPGVLPVGVHKFYVEAVRLGCTSSISERTEIIITVFELPTITLGANPIVCIGIATAALPYTGTTENPITYSIVWSALTPGLADVTNAALPASPITITIPNGTAIGTYNGKITVKNGNGCSAAAPVDFTLTIKPKLPQPTLTISAN